MAQRGTPLPFAVREQIKELRRQGDSVRKAAAQLQVSKTTVVKYRPK